MLQYTIESHVPEGFDARCAELRDAGWFIHLDTFRLAADSEGSATFYAIATKSKQDADFPGMEDDET